ncbi:MAG: hypothetical protein O3C28_03240 [Proteobacteria bacterium]|nr:hypothetical protein [Pseudomonadota bacterium]
MNIEAIGIFAEVIGAAAVVLSVIYLASQIRQGYTQLDQNNAIAKANAQTDLHFRYQELIRVMLDKPGLREIVIRGLNGYDLLNNEHKAHFIAYITPLVVHFDIVLRLHESKLVDNDFLEEFRLMTLGFVSTHGGRQWWAENKYFWIKTVREYLDAELANTTTLPNPITKMAMYQLDEQAST